MAVSAKKSAVESYALPDAIQYSGKLTLNAGVGRLPAILSFTDTALDLNSRPSAQALLLSLVIEIIYFVAV